MRRLAMISAIALLATACRANGGASGVPLGSPDETPQTAGSGVPRCEEVDWISAPAKRYRDSPIYVANEQPTERILAWASGQSGFEELWIDRDHLGWITVAFSSDADARQADLERLFPEVGVVAVGVE